ncbi:cytochrome oxidase subunit I, partial [Myroides sp. C20-1]
MKIVFFTSCFVPLKALFFTPAIAVETQTMQPFTFSFNGTYTAVLLVLLMAMLLVLACVFLYVEAKNLLESYQKSKMRVSGAEEFQLTELRPNQLKQLRAVIRSKKHWGILLLALCFQSPAWAQKSMKLEDRPLMEEPGILITIGLLMIPILAGIWMMVVQVRHLIQSQKKKIIKRDIDDLVHYFENLSEEDLEVFMQRKEALDYTFTKGELSGKEAAEDKKGLISIHKEEGLPVVSTKKKNPIQADIDPQLARIVLWFLGTASFWLLIGT